MKLKIQIDTTVSEGCKPVIVEDESGKEMLIRRITFDWRAGDVPKVRLTLIQPAFSLTHLEEAPTIDMDDEDFRRLARKKGYHLIPAEGPDLTREL